MLPVKIDHDHDRIQKIKSAKVVDLRDYGLAPAAPEENGKHILKFRMIDNGTLVPAA